MQTVTHGNGHVAGRRRKKGSLTAFPTELEIEAPAKGKSGRKPSKAKAADSEQISIPPLETQTLLLTVRGLTPLIVHKFSDKSRKQMADAQSGAPRHKKAPKVPEEEFKGCLYVIDEKKGIYGFPASGFKKAIVSACRFAEGISMSKAYGALHVLGDILPIKGSKPKMREDIVRVGKFGAKTADIRYRPEFEEGWKIDLKILYNSRIINKQTIAHLLNIAGFSVGIGEWRPEKSGQYGMFEVASKVDAEPLSGRRSRGLAN